MEMAREVDRAPCILELALGRGWRCRGELSRSGGEVEAKATWPASSGSCSMSR